MRIVNDLALGEFAREAHTMPSPVDAQASVAIAAIASHIDIQVPSVK